MSLISRVFIERIMEASKESEKLPKARVKIEGSGKNCIVEIENLSDICKIIKRNPLCKD